MLWWRDTKQCGEKKGSVSKQTENDEEKEVTNEKVVAFFNAIANM